MLEIHMSVLQRVVAVFIGGCIAVYVLMLARYDPSRSPALFPKCGLNAYTGLLCPGCGGQRAVHYMLNGQVVRALRCNAMPIPLTLYCLFRGMQWTRVRRYARGGRKNHHEVAAASMPRLQTEVVYVVLLGGAYMVLRNIQMFPFEFLRPA
jgi:hypothetical protein